MLRTKVGGVRGLHRKGKFRTQGFLGRRDHSDDDQEILEKKSDPEGEESYREAKWERRLPSLIPIVCLRLPWEACLEPQDNS